MKEDCFQTVILEEKTEEILGINKNVMRCPMEQYIIKGGNPLVGEVEIGGAKNAALGILAAAIMTDETVKIENLPDVQDINVLLAIARTSP